MKQACILLSLIVTTGILSGCDPMFDVAGAYFPAWIICVIPSVILTILIRALLVRLQLDSEVGPRGIVYISMFTAFSLVIYLSFFTT